MAYFLRDSLPSGAWLILLAAEAQASTENTTTDALVGWTAAPTQRGTYALIWSCLSTIFACTWSILHLNVPGLLDGTWRKFIRKIKWMIINMLFPEFILAKGICDLRLALDQLRRLDEFIRQRQGERGIAKTTTVTNEWMDCTYEWKWKIKYPQWSSTLYRLLALELPSNPNDSEIQEDTSSLYELQPRDHPNDIGGQGGLASIQERKNKMPREPERWIIRKTQKWTVVHSYYAQMGGLLYLDLNARGHRYYALTTSKLTTRYRFNAEDANFDHPLIHLVLGEQDIKDKSKADWLAKGLAVLQITWLVVNLIARGVAGLPITQLEIATASFAVLAILTYMANMWKPKDISQSTKLPVLPAGVPISSEVDHSQSLKDRLLSREPNSRPQSRVPNDSIWLEGDVPFIFGLMALSSLLFGGLHCIAWNYEFPSLIERDCWRIASLTSALLPLLVLALSLVSNYMSNGLLESRLLSAFRAHIRPWDQSPKQDDWWRHMSNPSYQSWSDEELSALLYMPADERNWDEKPSMETIDRIKSQESSPRLSHFAITFMRDLPNRLLPVRESWRRALEGDVTTRPGLPYVRRKQLVDGQAQHMFILRVLTPDPRPLAVWDEYEAFVRQKLSMHDAPSVKSIFENVYLQANIDVAVMKKLQHTVTFVSNCVNIFSSIVYAFARLTIMVLIFSCLRATPERAYQNTPWIHFIPNIS